MRCLVQSYRTGELSLEEIPAPAPSPDTVLVRNVASLISPGTERMMREMAQKSLLGKARERPDLVRQVLDKARRDGIISTLAAVRNRLDTLVPLGYSSAGMVLDAGEGMSEFRPGDPVASAGAGYASHAEIIRVPRNLVIKLPGGVDFESAAFTTIGAIALHGLRLAEPQIGDRVAVIGLGMVGLITVQLARAAGCQVIAMDPNADRCRLAQQLGCQFAATTSEQLEAQPVRTDAVIITASTSSSEPVELAGAIARDRARIVAVGAVGMKIPRRTFYDKELDFRVSRSYGPGRYDPAYEEKGHDYPIGYVPWTINRNMKAFAQLMEEGKVDVKVLTTHRFPIDEAVKAYDLISAKNGEPCLGVLLTYPESAESFSPTAPLTRRVNLQRAAIASTSHAQVGVGLLGAGSFATTTLLPAMKKVPGIDLVGVCTATGLSARHAADKFGFSYCSTDEVEVLNDPQVNAVVIATRHHLHARQARSALQAGKHVFVEKPLALSKEELTSVVREHQGGPGNILTVGYNRRFAPMARQLKSFLSNTREPLSMHYLVNAGYIPLNNWVQDPEQGGGRIIGEVCHFVDFLTFLSDSLPVQVYARGLPNSQHYQNDNVTVILDFSNGSVGTVTYVANGDRAFPKERVEVTSGGSVGVLEDFRSLELFHNGRSKVHKARLGQDKGHRGEWEAFVESIRDQTLPIPFEHLVSASLTTFGIEDALRTGEPVPIETEAFIANSLSEDV